MCEMQVIHGNLRCPKMTKIERVSELTEDSGLGQRVKKKVLLSIVGTIIEYWEKGDSVNAGNVYGL